MWINPKAHSHAVTACRISRPCEWLQAVAHLLSAWLHALAYSMPCVCDCFSGHSMCVTACHRSFSAVWLWLLHRSFHVCDWMPQLIQCRVIVTASQVIPCVWLHVLYVNAYRCYACFKSMPIAQILCQVTVPRDFWFNVFFIISFPQSPEYPISALSIFFEKSRRYSQLKVHQRFRWSLTPVANEKIFLSEKFWLFSLGTFG